MVPASASPPHPPSSRDGASRQFISSMSVSVWPTMHEVLVGEGQQFLHVLLLLVISHQHLTELGDLVSHLLSDRERVANHDDERLAVTSVQGPCVAHHGRNSGLVRVQFDE
eukprot:CAMPEP_0175860544 /NCGR_PEP_ID=MMETSP0107_2-20121207/30873_1 /TAXON_ID=195067 ORGANISM="Goniomonas pacifica, Strain CCMP1869" /NCGR_SAMPLE_ID=MMETSP0107_2 /ASSEMBLY_ACC=CAM_ASM_000203 /LENGTH=110 /DNA_ID=CAMNT_0017177293 /DNA_START=101 /DNA_END=433 /DNA_ORIENTATION=+